MLGASATPLDMLCEGKTIPSSQSERRCQQPAGASLCDAEAAASTARKSSASSSSPIFQESSSNLATAITHQSAQIVQESLQQKTWPNSAHVMELLSCLKAARGGCI
jgi:hypothetical protein